MKPSDELKKDCLLKMQKSLQAIAARWADKVEINTQPLEAISQVVFKDAKQNLQSQGEAVEYAYFIVSGILRFYYVTESGKDLNKCFYSEGDFAGDFSAYFLNRASRFSIATVEPALLVAIPAKEYQAVKEQVPELSILLEQAMNTLMVRNERREEDFLTMTAKERFQKFVTHFPYYLDRIPQKQIASYLGITPEALSKYKRLWLNSEELRGKNR